MRLNLGEHANAGGVYRITCLVNGWVYIGQAKCFRTRMYGHESNLRKGKHQNKRLAADFAAHGTDAFEVVVVSVIADPAERTREELRLIREVFGPGCYNARDRITPNTLGKKMSPEAIEKCRIAQRGRKHSPETIEKMRAVWRDPKRVEQRRAEQLGKKHTPDAIEKMRRKRASPETIEKMRAAAIRRLVQSPETM